MNFRSPIVAPLRRRETNHYQRAETHTPDDRLDMSRPEHELFLKIFSSRRANQILSRKKQKGSPLFGVEERSARIGNRMVGTVPPPWPVPEGTIENSPAIHRWAWGGAGLSLARDERKPLRVGVGWTWVLPSLPGLVFGLPLFPAMNRRAILFRLAGGRRSPFRSKQRRTELALRCFEPERRS